MNLKESHSGDQSKLVDWKNQEEEYLETKSTLIQRNKLQQKHSEVDFPHTISVDIIGACASSKYWCKSRKKKN